MRALLEAMFILALKKTNGMLQIELERVTPHVLQVVAKKGCCALNASGIPLKRRQLIKW